MSSQIAIETISSTPITIGDKIVSAAVVEAAMTAMWNAGTFDNMDVATAFARAGFEPNDLWVRQEAANRLLQKARKAGLIRFSKKQWRATREFA